MQISNPAFELEARGASARLGLLLPHNTTTTSQNPQGTPLTVRVPYLLACWLVLGCLLVSDEVRDLYLFEHVCNVVGAERIGAALDCLLGSYDTMEAHTPSRPMPDACYPLVCLLLCVGGVPPGAPSWRPSRRLGGALSCPCSCTTSTRFNSLEVV